MGLVPRLRRYLDHNLMAYTLLPHVEAFAAQRVAAATHVSGWQVAKVLVGKDERGYVMAVLPATCRLDLPTFRRLTRREHLLLATEDDLAFAFPDCQVGAMPPFGNLYGMPVFADTCFGPGRDLVFEAGNHHEVVKLPFADFERAAKPVVTDFCRRE